jgi:thymidylate kinase
MSFVIIEGPNGAGKTSLIKKMSDNGIKTLSSPNGTPLAKFLRPVARATEPWEDVDKRVKFLAFSAARLDEYIRMVKDSEELVIADRWWTSTYVYQCCLEGFSTDFLQYTIHPDEKIDLVIGLDAKDEVLLERVKKERELNKSHGNCSWTKDTKIMTDIAGLYRTELPAYLKELGIKYQGINTENSTPDQVYNNVMNTIHWSYDIT